MICDNIQSNISYLTHMIEKDTKKRLELSREPSEMELTDLGQFVAYCLLYDIAFSLCFETGRFIPEEVMAEFGFDVAAVPADRVVQGEKGFAIEVGDRGYTDGDGRDILYKTVGEALSAAYHLLAIVLAERKSEAL